MSQSWSRDLQPPLFPRKQRLSRARKHHLHWRKQRQPQLPTISIDSPCTQPCTTREQFTSFAMLVEIEVAQPRSGDFAPSLKQTALPTTQAMKSVHALSTKTWAGWNVKHPLILFDERFIFHVPFWLVLKLLVFPSGTYVWSALSAEYESTGYGCQSCSWSAEEGN